MRIDFDKPHSKYCGGGIPKGAPSGTVYRQDTSYYNGKGELIVKQVKMPEIIPPPGLQPHLDQSSTTGGYVPTTQTAIADQSIVQERPLESRHWKQIKQKVEEAGGEFTTKAEGVSFLRERESG